MNSQSLLASRLRDKDYRDAFVASRLKIGLPMQCRALRESREWTQPQLADAAGMTQPRISEIERPGERSLNLETLLRLASAFDVALQVRFVPFSSFVTDDDNVDLDNFHIEPFEEDLSNLEHREEQMKSVIFLGPAHSQAGLGSKLNQPNEIGANTAALPEATELAAENRPQREVSNGTISHFAGKDNRPIRNINAESTGRNLSERDYVQAG